MLFKAVAVFNNIIIRALCNLDISYKYKVYTVLYYTHL